MSNSDRPASATVRFEIPAPGRFIGWLVGLLGAGVVAMPVAVPELRSDVRDLAAVGLAVLMGAFMFVQGRMMLAHCRNEIDRMRGDHVAERETLLNELRLARDDATKARDDLTLELRRILERMQ